MTKIIIVGKSLSQSEPTVTLAEVYKEVLGKRYFQQFTVSLYEHVILYDMTSVSHVSCLNSRRFPDVRP